MSKLTKYILIIIAIALWTIGCDDDNVITNHNQNNDDQDTTEVINRPEGWEYESHDKKAPPNYDLIFKSNTVERIDITIDSTNWQAMISDITTSLGAFGKGDSPNTELETFMQPPNGGVKDPDMIEATPIYVPCTILYRDKQWWNVGIRFKGNSTLSRAWKEASYKLPFRLNFDKFEDAYPEIKNQRFYGFDNLSLDNSFTDKSFMRQKLAMECFREAGVPAVEVCWMQVYIDKGLGPEYFGVYTISELIDDPMLERVFGSSKGNLYAPSGIGATWSTFDQASFDKESNEDAGDWTDVIVAIGALNANRADAAIWRQNLEQYLNVDGFLQWLAVNTIIRNWDSYGRMAQNYYLYNNDSKLQWIPWDCNEAFTIATGDRMQIPTSVMHASVNQQWPLIRYLMDDSVYRHSYIVKIKQNINYPLTTGWLSTKLVEYSALIRPYVMEEKAPYTALKSGAEYTNAIGALQNYINTRLPQVINEMKQY